MAAPVNIEGLIDARPMTGLQIRVVALCSLATFLDGYDIQALGLAVPALAREFGVAPPLFAGALSGSLVGMALGAMFVAPFGDRLGRRIMLVAMLVLMGGTTLGAMLARGPFEMAAWRIVTGIGLGATVPIAVAMVAEYVPARSRAALITLMVACTALGSFAAGFAAPLLEAKFGWRGIFGVGGVLPLIAALLLFAALPESLRFLALRDPADPRIARQLARLAPGLPETLVKVGERSAGYRPSVMSLFAPALRSRTILLWAIFWLNLSTNYSLISWLPTLLAEAGWARGEAQRATGLLAIGGITGGLLLAWLADRGRAVPALVIAYLATAAVLSLFVTGGGDRATWLILLAFVGGGAFGAQMAIGSLSATFYPLEVRTTGLGWSSGIGRVGSICGPLLLAFLMTIEVSAAAILALLMVPMLACAVCVTLLPRALRG